MRRDPPPLTAALAPSVLVVVPTFLRDDAELDSVQAAITSAAENGYPGEVAIVVAVDDAPATDPWYRQLSAWCAREICLDNVHLFLVSTVEGVGREGAIQRALAVVKERSASGPLSHVPPVLIALPSVRVFARDEIEHMVQALRRPRWHGLRSTRPMVVESRSITCAWTEIYEIAPRWTAFWQTLRFVGWFRWWLGQGAPPFARSEDAAEATASLRIEAVARWARFRSDGSLVLRLPRTPIHAAAHVFHSILCPPIVHLQPRWSLLPISAEIMNFDLDPPDTDTQMDIAEPNLRLLQAPSMPAPRPLLLLVPPPAPRIESVRVPPQSNVVSLVKVRARADRRNTHPPRAVRTPTEPMALLDAQINIGTKA